MPSLYSQKAAVQTIFILKEVLHSQQIEHEVYGMVWWRLHRNPMCSHL